MKEGQRLPKYHVNNFSGAEPVRAGFAVVPTSYCLAALDRKRNTESVLVVHSLLVAHTTPFPPHLAGNERYHHVNSIYDDRKTKPSTVCQ